ncbi:MAG: DNA repair protein RadC [Polyangiales bacterium]
MEPSIDTLELGPRERLALHGRAALSDADLIAVLLGTGLQSLPVGVLAGRILADAGGLHGLARLPLSQLEAQTGIGLTKACRLLAAFELGARGQAQPFERKRPLTSSRDVAAALRPRFLHEVREHFLAIALDAKNRPLAELTVAVGGLASCAITPADVFRPVLQAAAVGVIFVHNHPSGDPAPSEADVAVTERLCRAGEVLGISVFDHVVLGEPDYFSFADAGWLARITTPVSTP